MDLHAVPGYHRLPQFDKRKCYICLFTEEDSPSRSFVHPCKCIGSMRWVHQSCLCRWLEALHKYKPMQPPACPHCKTEYIIFPRRSTLLRILYLVDVKIYENVCTLVLDSLVKPMCVVVLGSFFTVFTILQIYGMEEAKEILSAERPIEMVPQLLIPPLVLTSIKMVPIEDILLSILRRGSKLPLLKYYLPSEYECIEETNHASTWRVTVGVLTLPTIGKIIGQILFKSEPSKLKRVILGAVIFTCFKIAIKMYYKQKLHVYQGNVRILDMSENENKDEEENAEEVPEETVVEDGNC